MRFNVGDIDGSIVAGDIVEEADVRGIVGNVGDDVEGDNVEVL